MAGDCVNNGVKVVHVRHAPYDVYIGRAFAEFAASMWGNPYKVGRDGGGEAVLRLYEAHVLASWDLVTALPSLRGRTLGCWCKRLGDEPCHGDVLARLADHIEEVFGHVLVWTGHGWAWMEATCAVCGVVGHVSKGPGPDDGPDWIHNSLWFEDGNTDGPWTSTSPPCDGGSARRAVAGA